MAWNAGCQFVGIDYSNLISTNIYSEQFGEYSFILKDKKVSSEPVNFVSASLKLHNSCCHTLYKIKWWY